MAAIPEARRRGTLSPDFAFLVVVTTSHPSRSAEDRARAAWRISGLFLSLLVEAAARPSTAAGTSAAWTWPVLVLGLALQATAVPQTPGHTASARAVAALDAVANAKATADGEREDAASLNAAAARLALVQWTACTSP